MSKIIEKPSFLRSTASFLGAVLTILSIRWLLFEPYVIPSGSMIPSLLIHDHIVVNKLAFGIRIPFSKSWLWRFDHPKRGDVVVFKSVEDSGYFMIKRVVGLPGDTIEVNPEGELLVNGSPVQRVPLEEPTNKGQYYPVTTADVGADFSNYTFFKEDLDSRQHQIMLSKDNYRYSIEPLQIPEGHYFMMGDNRDNSKDSRYWGPLPEENLLGRATFVWLSCEETLAYVPFLCNPLKLRWKRFLHKIN